MNLLERFGDFMDWLGRGVDYFLGALAWLLIVSALVAAAWVVVGYVIHILGA